MVCLSHSGFTCPMVTAVCNPLNSAYHLSGPTIPTALLLLHHEIVMFEVPLKYIVGLEAAFLRYSLSVKTA